jgi:hypothetical protein
MHKAWLDRHAFQFEPAGECAFFACRAIVIGFVVRQLPHAVPTELRCGAFGFDTCGRSEAGELLVPQVDLFERWRRGEGSESG